MHPPESTAKTPESSASAHAALERFLVQFELLPELSPSQRQALLATVSLAHGVPPTWASRWLQLLVRNSQRAEVLQDVPFWRRALDLLDAAWPRASELALSLRNDSDIPLGELYTNQASAAIRGRIGRIWARLATPATRGAFLSAMLHQPPDTAEDVTLAFTPWFQGDLNCAVPLFPDLLQQLAHPTVAACALDLANYLFQQGTVHPHPATPVREALGQLLEQISQRLLKLVETGGVVGPDDPAPQAVVRDSSALVVSLCIALARIGDKSLAYRLRSAATLPHRQLQAEAAYALAVLGEEEGIHTLVELAQHVGVRSRAMHSLQELGKLDSLPADLQTPTARRLGDLAIWLAEPTQFGLAPNDIELLDERELVWPGEAAPCTCQLAAYEYRFARAGFRGIALVAPWFDTAPADLSQLSTARQYCYFAGRGIEHPEIWHADLNGPAQNTAHVCPPDEAQAWETRARAQGYTRVRGERHGSVLGSPFWIGQAQRQSETGLLLLSGETAEWWPEPPSGSGKGRPLTPADLAALWQGQVVLAHFNPGLLEG